MDDREFEMSEQAKRDYNRYLAAAHAMQSGVAFTIESEPGQIQPKQLRVGINASMVDNAALVALLVKKGLITYEEFFAALADGMESEVQKYAKRIGPNVTLR